MALLRSYQCTSVATAAQELPATTLLASINIAIGYMQRFCNVFYSYSSATHALVRLETIGRI
jgi:hypothetical protein